MAFGQEEDDQIPEYHPFLQAVAGMNDGGAAAAAPVQPATAAAPQPAIPYYLAAPGAQQQQQPQQQPQAQQPPQQAAAPAVVLPPAPQAPPANIERYRSIEAQLARDYQPVKVPPKWYERLAGGLVGAGVGYRDPALGAQLGGQVTNRRQIEADGQRQQRIDADKSALDTFKEESQLQNQGFENQIRGFGADMSRANAQRDQSNNDREFSRGTANDQRQQGNLDREFSRGTANDQRQQGNEDRNFGRATGNDQRDQRNSDRDFAERKREFDANRQLEQQRVTAERDKANPKSDKTTLTAEQFQGLISTRDKQYEDAGKQRQKELEDAEPKERPGIEAKWQTWATGKQKEWNDRLAQGDPEGKYAPKGAGAQPPQQPPAQPQRPQQQGQQQQGQPIGPQKTPTKLTDVNTAKQYLAKAGGDPQKARQLAKQDNYIF